MVVFKGDGAVVSGIGSLLKGCSDIRYNVC